MAGSNFCSALLFTCRAHRENPETTAITVVSEPDRIDLHCGAVMLRLNHAEAKWIVSRLNAALSHYGCQFFAVAIVLALIINLIALSIVYAIGHIEIVWK